MGKIDWSGRNYESTYEVYPAGTYKVKVKEVEDTTAKSTGNPQFKVQGEIMEGEYAGKPITQFLANTDNSTWKIMQLVYACGVDVAQLPDMDSNGTAFSKVVHSLKGKEAWWVITKVVDNKGNDKNDTLSPHFARIEGEDLVSIDVEADAGDGVPDWVKE